MGDSPLYNNIEHTAQESCEAVEIITSNWKASSKNQQHNLRESPRKEQTGVQAESEAGLMVLSACLYHLRFQLHLGKVIITLRLHHQAEGKKVAESTDLILDDPNVSASLMVLCTFLSICELQSQLSETLVSGAQQGRCKINRI